MDISSISLSSLFASSNVDPVADVVGVYAGSVVAIRAVGAKDVAKVEGTIVVTVGITVVGASSRLACFS